jgi:hypothetical protein
MDTMTHYERLTAEARTTGVYALANMVANGAMPDSPDSPGGQFLAGVAMATAEALAYVLDNDETPEPSDLAHEVADGAVPVGTWDIWQTFVDLAAWDATDEYAEELGELSIGGRQINDHGNGMTALAAIGLYSVAKQVASQLIEAWTADDDV